MAVFSACVSTKKKKNLKSCYHMNPCTHSPEYPSYVVTAGKAQGRENSSLRKHTQPARRGREPNERSVYSQRHYDVQHIATYDYRPDRAIQSSNCYCAYPTRSNRALHFASGELRFFRYIYIYNIYMNAIFSAGYRHMTFNHFGCRHRTEPSTCLT